MTLAEKCEAKYSELTESVMLSESGKEVFYFEFAPSSQYGNEPFGFRIFTRKNKYRALKEKRSLYMNIVEAMKLYEFLKKYLEDDGNKDSAQYLTHEQNTTIS